MKSLILNNELTMSSREIAELTGKNHADVLRDIRRILAEVEIDESKFAGVYSGGNGQQRPCYNLPRRECELVVAGYSAKYRLAIIDRWHELENTVRPKTALELAKEQVLLLEKLEQANQTIEKQNHSLIEKDNLILASNEASIKAGEILVREFVKSIDIIDIGEKKFYQWLREQGYIMKDSCQPYQQWVARGFFTWKPTEAKCNGEYRYTLRITPRGKVWLAAKYMAFVDNQIAIY